MDSVVTFHLESFTGPLDLLLFLIAKNKVEITDIPISLILEQYLEYLDRMSEMDMEISSAFVTMAAQLIYIKTRILLPREEPEDEEDPRQTLAEMLLEYKRFKTAAAKFDPILCRGQDILVRDPLPPDNWTINDYRHIPNDLLRTLHNMREREKRRSKPGNDAFDAIVGAEPYPVDTKVSVLTSMLKHKRSVFLNEVYRCSRSRSELVAVFLAVLELLNTKKLEPPEDTVADDLPLRFLKESEEGGTV